MKTCSFFSPHTCLLALGLSVSPMLHAQSLSTHEPHFEIGFLAGLHTDGYEVSTSAAWFPCRYVGLKADVGCVGEIKKMADWGTAYTEHSYCIRFKFTPSVEFRTPTLFHWPQKQATFCLFANPGLSLSPGGAGSHHADWYNWTVRTGLLMKTPSARIALGYGISNYYLLSGNPRSYQVLYAPQSHPLQHLGYVSVAFTL